MKKNKTVAEAGPGRFNLNNFIVEMIRMMDQAEVDEASAAVEMGEEFEGFKLTISVERVDPGKITNDAE